MPATILYWRPGCLFCAILMRRLRKKHITFETRNIWEDTDAAAFVRSVANGNETVPTVTLGTTVLVNPTARQVLDAHRGSRKDSG